MSRWVPLVAAAMLGIAGALAGSACTPVHGGAARSVPAYAGRSVELFDDVIEARAVGLDPEVAISVRGDPIFRERVQIADAALRVVVDTVTVKQEDSGASYQMGFRVLDKLAGANPPPGSFTVRVDKNGPSAGILRSYDSQLVGRRFVAFVRLFAKPDGEHDYHFHLSPDSKDVAAAVEEATILENLRN